MERDIWFSDISALETLDFKKMDLNDMRNKRRIR